MLLPSNEGYQPIQRSLSDDVCQRSNIQRCGARSMVVHHNRCGGCRDASDCGPGAHRTGLPAFVASPIRARSTRIDCGDPWPPFVRSAVIVNPGPAWQACIEQAGRSRPRDEPARLETPSQGLGKPPALAGFAQANRQLVLASARARFVSVIGGARIDQDRLWITNRPSPVGVVCDCQSWVSLASGALC